MSKLTKDEFEQGVKKHNPNIDIVGEYKSLHSPITYHCNVCNFVETIKDANSLYRGLTGCGCCSGRKIVKGVNDLGTKCPWIVPYFIDKELVATLSPKSTHVVKLQCPVCHTFISDKVVALTSRAHICPICSNTASFGERVVKAVLDNLNVEYQYDKSTEWSKNYRYDFIIESINTIIEVDGVQHLSLNQKQIDDIKNNIASENGYSIIRVPYYKSKDMDYVIDSVKTNLSNIFDLSDIDWNDILCRTLVDTTLSQVVDKWNKQEMTQKEMCEQLNMGQEKFRNYLKLANELGIISYNSQENKRKTQLSNLQKGNRKKMKKVMCLNDGRIFDSCASAERFYGLKVGKFVGAICNGRKKSIKGLKFIFIKKENK